MSEKKINKKENLSGETKNESPNKESFEKPKSIKKLYRSETNRIIGGVAGGIGEYFNIDPTIIRILFILLAFHGFGILLYLILWIIIPSKEAAGEGSEKTIRKNIDEMKIKTESFVENIRKSNAKNQKTIIGIIFIILGFLWFLNNFGFFRFYYLYRLWPLILIIIGIVTLLKNSK